MEEIKDSLNIALEIINTLLQNKEIKKYLIDLNLSFQEYVIRLIREDMKNNAKGGKD